MKELPMIKVSQVSREKQLVYVASKLERTNSYPFYSELCQHLLKIA